MLYDEATMTRDEEEQLDQMYMEQQLLEYGALCLYSDRLDHDIEIAMAQNQGCHAIRVPEV